MKTVYKSNAAWCLLGSVLISFLVPLNDYYTNESGTYPTIQDSIISMLFLNLLGIPFIGAFCKTVIEDKDGFEVHYMFGFQKKWFGKDFLTFNHSKESLLFPEATHRVSNEHIKFWDGGKSTIIYPMGTANFQQLSQRVKALARDFHLKKRVEKAVEETVCTRNKPNVKIIEDFLAKSYHLFHTLKDNVEWDERMRARKTASFGVSYDYSGITYTQTEMLPDLVPICEKINEEFGFYPNNCLMNFYVDGNSSLGFHSDSSEELKDGTGVSIISLGAERDIHYKNKADKSLIVPYKLKSGALLYMGKDVQEEWLHAIPKDESAGARISLTFREIIK